MVEHGRPTAATCPEIFPCDRARRIQSNQLRKENDGTIWGIETTTKGYKEKKYSQDVDGRLGSGPSVCQFEDAHIGSPSSFYHGRACLQWSTWTREKMISYEKKDIKQKRQQTKGKNTRTLTSISDSKEVRCSNTHQNKIRRRISTGSGIMLRRNRQKVTVASSGFIGLVSILNSRFSIFPLFTLITALSAIVKIK